jgi:hypothetical protein
MFVRSWTTNDTRRILCQIRSTNSKYRIIIIQRFNISIWLKFLWPKTVFIWPKFESIWPKITPIPKPIGRSSLICGREKGEPVVAKAARQLPKSVRSAHYKSADGYHQKTCLVETVVHHKSNTYHPKTMASANNTPDNTQNPLVPTNHQKGVGSKHQTTMVTSNHPTTMASCDDEETMATPNHPPTMAATDHPTDNKIDNNNPEDNNHNQSARTSRCSV